MANQETIPVTLWVAGRDYQIRVRPQDEEAVRKAAQVADQRFQDMRRDFDGADNQDFLAMCLIMYATESVLNTGNLNPVYLQEVKEMEAEIDKVLKK